MWKYFLSAKNKGILNTSFSNPVINLKMSEFLEVNIFAEKNITPDTKSNFQI